MRYLFPVVFLILSLLSVSSAGAAHSAYGMPNHMMLQTTPAAISTSTSGVAIPARTGPPLSLTLTLLGMCCVFAIFIGVVVLGFVARNPKNQEENNSNM